MTNNIKTRILNKIDTWSKWEKIKESFKPLRGEICIVEIPTDTTDTGLTPPAIGIKVGDGQRNFGALPWIQAIAGDVATEIKALTGVADIDTKIANLASGRKLATVAELNAFSESLKTLSENLGSVASTVNNAEHGNTALKSAIDTLSSNKVDKSVAENASSDDKLVKKSTVTANINTAKTELNAAIQGVQTNVDTLTTGVIKDHTEAIGTINSKIGDVSIGTDDNEQPKSITKAIADLQSSIGDSDKGLGSQVIDLTSRMNAAETAIGTKAAQSDLTALDGRVGTAEGKIKTLEDEMDVVQAATAGYNGSNTIATAISNVNSTANAASAKATANEAAINVLNAGKDTTGSVAYTAAAAVAEIVAGADENFDTLQEIAAWITNDTTGAAEMANDIAQMQGLLGVTEGETTLPAPVDTRIATAISNLNIGQYATAENLAAAVGQEGDTSEATSIYGAKKYAEEKASAAQAAAEATAAADATAKANAAQTAAISAAAVDAQAKIDALSAEGGQLKSHGELIAGLQSTIANMDVSDTANGVVTSVSQTDGKIAITHKKITMDEFDPEVIFIFDCGNASRDAEQSTEQNA